LKRIAIITGSTGLVGSTASEFLIKKGFKVIGIDNNYRSKLFGISSSTYKQRKYLTKKKNYYHFNCDIRHHLNIEKIFKKYSKNTTLIIHCAAQPSHDWAYKKPLVDFDINARATLNLLNCTKKYCPRSVFIFLSTNKVYGDSPNNINFIEKKTRWDVSKTSKFKNGIDEKMSIDNSVHSFFGASKTYADLIVQEFGKNLNLKTGIFRCGCITGPKHAGAKLHGFLSFLVKRCIEEKQYELIGYKGKQVRDNIHSSDLMNAFWQFYKKPKKGEVYNIGGGKATSCSVIEAISYIEKKLNIKIKRKFIKAPRSGDHIWYISNLKKFKGHYSLWKIKYNFSKIMDELINNLNK
jgi:CDP-paratose 2-epimerase